MITFFRGIPGLIVLMALGVTLGIVGALLHQEPHFDLGQVTSLIGAVLFAWGGVHLIYKVIDRVTGRNMEED